MATRATSLSQNSFQQLYTGIAQSVVGYTKISMSQQFLTHND